MFGVLPFHDGYFRVGKSIKLVDYLVNKVVGCFNASLEWSKSVHSRRKFDSYAVPDIGWAWVWNHLILLKHLQQVFKGIVMKALYSGLVLLVLNRAFQYFLFQPG